MDDDLGASVWRHPRGIVCSVLLVWLVQLLVLGFTNGRQHLALFSLPVFAGGVITYIVYRKVIRRGDDGY